MNRRSLRLAGVSAIVGVTLLVAWIMVQALVVRPAIGQREPQRIQQAFEAAEAMRSGLSKHEVEDLQGVDLRVFRGSPEGPPPGEGWVRLVRHGRVLWKRDGADFGIAVWTGEVWAVLQEDPPVGSTIALAFAAVGFPLALLLFGLGQRALRHQDAAEEALERLAAGNLDERLDEGAGSAEVRRMAAAVNGMADRLTTLLAIHRERMAGLSHELRTPLTRIRLELELARRGSEPARRLERVERDIEAFDGLLTEMLALSQLQLVGAARVRREVVDLAGLAQWVVDEQGATDVVVRGNGTGWVDPKLMARLISNLLRNSARHAPGSRRWIDVGPDRLAVGDDGPGMQDRLRDTAFEPFERRADSPGHGLGLAIVAQVVVLHGGTVALSDPPGLVVSVRLPPNPTPAPLRQT